VRYSIIRPTREEGHKIKPKGSISYSAHTYSFCLLGGTYSEYGSYEKHLNLSQKLDYESADLAQKVMHIFLKFYR
jgi:hypothetical protein